MKKRFGLTVFNYIVTSNHIHLLVKEDYENQVSECMQLIASRTAQEFNIRKKRQGAFWQDRYHATAVDNSAYLIQCLTYIDLNMVRAGVVEHPSQWQESGFNEIQSPPTRYQIINQEALCRETEVSSFSNFQQQHLNWTSEALLKNELVRDDKWTESLAVGGQKFIENYREEIGNKVSYRRVEVVDNCCVVRESQTSYSGD